MDERPSDAERAQPMDAAGATPTVDSDGSWQELPCSRAAVEVGPDLRLIDDIGEDGAFDGHAARLLGDGPRVGDLLTAWPPIDEADCQPLGETPQLPAAGVGTPDVSATAASAAGEEAEQRLDRRMISMCDRLWEKVAQMGDELAYLSNESSRLGATLAHVATQLDSHAHGDAEVRLGALDSRMDIVEQGLLRVQAERKNALQEQRDYSRLKLVEQSCSQLVEDIAQLGQQADTQQSSFTELVAHVRADTQAELESAISKLEAFSRECCESLRHDTIDAQGEQLAKLRHHADSNIEQHTSRQKQLTDELRQDLARMVPKETLETLNQELQTMARDQQNLADALERHALDCTGQVQASVKEHRAGLEQQQTASEAFQALQAEAVERWQQSLAEQRSVSDVLQAELKMQTEGVTAALQEMAKQQQDRIADVIQRVSQNDDGLDAMRNVTRNQIVQLQQTLDDLEAENRAAHQRFANNQNDFAADLQLRFDQQQRDLAASRDDFQDGIFSLQMKVRQEFGHLEARSADLVKRLGVEVVERLAEELEPLRAETCQSRQDFEGQQRACVGRASAQEDALQSLAEESRAAWRKLEERVEESSAELRQELTDMAINSFHGEVKIWKGMMRQMGCQAIAPPTCP